MKIFQYLVEKDIYLILPGKEICCVIFIGFFVIDDQSTLNFTFLYFIDHDIKIRQKVSNANMLLMNVGCIWSTSKTSPEKKKNNNKSKDDCNHTYL